MKYNSLEGFIYYTSVRAFSEDWRNYLSYAKDLESKKSRERKSQKTFENLSTKYGKEVIERISNKEIWIGMTEEMLIDSWGNPTEINRTVLPSLVTKQYVYPNYKFVYVENGKVTSWQD